MATKYATKRAGFRPRIDSSLDALSISMEHYHAFGVAFSEHAEGPSLLRHWLMERPGYPPRRAFLALEKKRR